MKPECREVPEARKKFGRTPQGEAKNSYFTQVKCTGTLFDNFCSGEVTLSCTHSSTVLPGFPNFHLWLTALTPESESLRRCSGQVRPWESTHVYVTVVGRVVAISP